MVRTNHRRRRASSILKKNQAGFEQRPGGNVKLPKGGAKKAAEDLTGLRPYICCKFAPDHKTLNKTHPPAVRNPIFNLVK
jgi:hypothetical protein